MVNQLLIIYVVVSLGTSILLSILVISPKDSLEVKMVKVMYSFFKGILMLPTLLLLLLLNTVAGILESIATTIASTAFWTTHYYGKDTCLATERARQVSDMSGMHVTPEDIENNN